MGFYNKQGDILSEGSETVMWHTVNSLLKDSLYRGRLRYNGHSQGTN